MLAGHPAVADADVGQGVIFSTGVDMAVPWDVQASFRGCGLLARVSAALRVKRLQDELRVRNAELEALSRTDTLTALPNRPNLCPISSAM